MKKLLKLLTATLPLVTFTSAEVSKLDSYHLFLSNWVMNSSDNLDRYLVEKNDTKSLSNTKIDIAYEGGLNTAGGFLNNLDFGLSLNLPRFENKVKLSVSKVKQNWNATDANGNVVSNMDISSNKSDDDKYDLMVEYQNHKGKRSSVGFTGGVRFNKVFFEPYIGLKAKYLIYSNDLNLLVAKNVLRFYLAGEIRDTISAKYIRLIDSDLQFGWYGNIDYSSKSNEQVLKSEFILHKKLGEFTFIRGGFFASSKLTNFKNPKKENFELYARYHHKLLNRDWLYYELTPAIEWKNDDKFSGSFTLKFKVGATFGGDR